MKRIMLALRCLFGNPLKPLLDKFLPNAPFGDILAEESFNLI